jgi:membrane protein DedA with SNARE-associated domain
MDKSAMSDQVLAALARYGLPALFVVVTIAAIGVPLPVALLLIVAGSLAAQGVINIWWAIAVATVGACAGDQIGYAIGHWGGKALIDRLARAMGKADGLKQLEAKAAKLGGAGIFFSRWLATPLGPWINFASGIANYSWLRFSVWDFLGETLCAVLYICLGLAFSDRVQALADVLGNLTWAIVGVVIAALLGWKLFTPRGTRRDRVDPARKDMA